MAKPTETIGWSLAGAGSGLGGLLLAAGCAGSCSACFGCVASGAALALLALARTARSDTTKGECHGLAASRD